MEDLRPKCKLIDTNWNIFCMLGRVSKTLKEHGKEDEAREVVHRVFNDAKSDYHAFEIIMEYVKVE